MILETLLSLLASQKLNVCTQLVMFPLLMHAHAKKFFWGMLNETTGYVEIKEKHAYYS